MRTAVVLCFLAASPVFAGEPNFHERPGSVVVSHSHEPVAHAYYDGQVVPCYETVRREPNLAGELVDFVYDYECSEPAHEISAIGKPLNSTLVNTHGVREATSVRISNGKIILE